MQRTGVADLVGAEHGLGCYRGGFLVADMDICQHLPRLDRLPALRAADDANRVVDRVVLRPATAGSKLATPMPSVAAA